MKNILIVEGESDKKFLESYIAYLQASLVNSGKFFAIDEIEEAKGQDGLSSVLDTQVLGIAKGEIKNIGVILDADEEGIEAKIQNKINPAIQKAFGCQDAIAAPNQKYPLVYGDTTIDICCHIFNLDGKGELEDILKEIRLDKDATMSMCWEQFVECIGGFSEIYDRKEYNKNFLNLYGRECFKKEGFSPKKIKSKSKNCEHYSQKYFDFEHERLQELRRFLELFRS